MILSAWEQMRDQLSCAFYWRQDLTGKHLNRVNWCIDTELRKLVIFRKLENRVDIAE